MKLIWSAFALEDRDAIFDYIEANSPLAAIVVDERIATAIRRLIEFPESGRIGRVRETRQLIISGTPYIAAYTFTPDYIRILRTAQLWPEKLQDS